MNSKTKNFLESIGLTQPEQLHSDYVQRFRTLTTKLRNANISSVILRDGYSARLITFISNINHSPRGLIRPDITENINNIDIFVDTLIMNVQNESGNLGQFFYDFDLPQSVNLSTFLNSDILTELAKYMILIDNIQYSIDQGYNASTIMQYRTALIRMRTELQDSIINSYKDNVTTNKNKIPIKKYPNSYRNNAPELEKTKSCFSFMSSLTGMGISSGERELAERRRIANQAKRARNAEAKRQANANKAETKRQANANKAEAKRQANAREAEAKAEKQRQKQEREAEEERQKQEREAEKQRKKQEREAEEERQKQEREAEEQRKKQEREAEEQRKKQEREAEEERQKLEREEQERVIKEAEEKRKEASRIARDKFKQATGSSSPRGSSSSSRGPNRPSPQPSSPRGRGSASAGHGGTPPQPPSEENLRREQEAANKEARRIERSGKEDRRRNRADKRRVRAAQREEKRRSGKPLTAENGLGRERNREEEEKNNKEDLKNKVEELKDFLNSTYNTDEKKKDAIMRIFNKLITEIISGTARERGLTKEQLRADNTFMEHLLSLILSSSKEITKIYRRLATKEYRSVRTTAINSTRPNLLPNEYIINRTKLEIITRIYEILKPNNNPNI